jgi:Fibronectin type III domain
MDNPFKKLSKNQLYIVIGSTAVIGGTVIFLHHKKTGSWNPFSPGSAGSSQGSTDPVTGLPYSQDNSVDPQTGLSYLSEAQQYGSVQAAEAAVSSFGQSSGSGTGTAPSPGPGDGASVSEAPQGTYTSNAAWAQAATAGLASIGYSETEVATALGDYLTQTPVTPAQASLINTAIAEYGPAPVGNLQVIPAAPSKTGTPANAVPAVSDGHVLSTGTSSAVVAWTGQNAAKYEVRLSGPGKMNGHLSTVTVTQAVFNELEPGHTYTASVTPYNSSGKSGKAGTIDFKTETTKGK